MRAKVHAHINSIPWLEYIRCLVRRHFFLCVILLKRIEIITFVFYVIIWFARRSNFILLKAASNLNPQPGDFEEKMQQIAAFNRIVWQCRTNISGHLIGFFLLCSLIFESCYARGPHHPKSDRRAQQQKHINEHLAFETQYVLYLLIFSIEFFFFLKFFVRSVKMANFNL